MISPMRHRVILQSPVGSANVRGAEEISWTNQGTVYARVRQLTGRERTAQDALTIANQVAEIEIRYRTDIDATWRVIWAPTLQGGGTVTHTYAIVAPPAPDERMSKLILTCAELSGDTEVL